MNLEQLINEYFDSKERLKDLQSTIRANQNDLTKLCIKEGHLHLLQLNESGLKQFRRRLGHIKEL